MHEHIQVLKRAPVVAQCPSHLLSPTENKTSLRFVQNYAKLWPAHSLGMCRVLYVRICWLIRRTLPQPLSGSNDRRPPWCHFPAQDTRNTNFLVSLTEENDRTCVESITACVKSCTPHWGTVLFCWRTLQETVCWIWALLNVRDYGVWSEVTVLTLAIALQWK